MEANTPSLSPDFGAMVVEALTEPFEDYSALTTEQLAAQKSLRAAEMAAGPRLNTRCIWVAILTAGITEPDDIDFAYAVMAVIRQAIAHPKFFELIVADYTAVGREEDAESFSRAVAEQKRLAEASA
jgi:hypothetical protein